MDLLEPGRLALLAPAPRLPGGRRRVGGGSGLRDDRGGYVGGCRLALELKREPSDLAIERAELPAQASNVAAGRKVEQMPDTPGRGRGRGRRANPLTPRRIPTCQCAGDSMVSMLRVHDQVLGTERNDPHASSRLVAKARRLGSPSGLATHAKKGIGSRMMSNARSTTTCTHAAGRPRRSGKAHPPRRHQVWKGTLVTTVFGRGLRAGRSPTPVSSCSERCHQ